MKEIEWVVRDEFGIHARPAGLFVKEAAKFRSDIAVKKGEKEADGKKLFGIMGLGVRCGDKIIIGINGEDEESAAAALTVFLEKNL
ncbi:MAG: HPr family phosphocarrier protein [Ruminococcaceae bacterium]|nr:HPr family phosphocarrier protein [Oscillospiraceae bacterium]